MLCLGLLIAVAEIVPELISLSLISLFRAVFVVGFDWVLISEPAILLFMPIRLFWGIPSFFKFLLLKITVFELAATFKGGLFVDSV